MFIIPIYFSSERNHHVVLSPERDLKIMMEVDKHKYTVDGKVIPLSCTGHLNRIFDPFDRMKISLNKSKKEVINGLSDLYLKQQYLLSTWDYSSYFGTRVHKMIENFFNGVEGVYKDFDESWHEPNIDKLTAEALRRDYTVGRFNREVDRRMIQFHKFFKMWSKSLEFLASEYMIYGEIKGEPICGSIDALFWANKEAREIVIVDWKTNGVIDGGYKKIIELVTSPKWGEEATKINHYFCQVHMYKHMLEQNYNVTVVGGYIVHLLDDRYTIYSCPLEECNCLS